ncbi:MAG: murein transglycosylase A [Proteobacteria bacterium]|nr:murein transglycosylase A [Pseudomonadota bacterium]
MSAAAAIGIVVAGGALYWHLRPVPPLPDRAVLILSAFSDLKGWGSADLQAPLSAFQRSCAQFRRLPKGRSLGANGIGGRVEDWQSVCDAAGAVDSADPGLIRRFFETLFLPVAIINNTQETGLFTGYYEPELRGRRHKRGSFTVPLYTRPKDLVTVDLGAFRENLRGQQIAGRVVGGRLRPFETRAAIEAGALANRGLELLWVDDPIEAFFLHIQGSGRIVLEDGSLQRVGYAGQNGHPYFAIGRELVARGALDREMVSLQSIRAWLAANPGEASAVMSKNPSFVFFRKIEGDGPLGAFQVPLTPRASLAIDRRYVPLGVPVWLETSLPEGGDRASQSTQPWHAMVVAQDTGGAIRGVVRGDIFFGAGTEAEAVAGRLNSPGRYFMLLPRSLVERGGPWRGAVAD